MDGQDALAANESRKGVNMNRNTSAIYQDLDQILVTREEIAAKVQELGLQITRDYAGTSPVMICILKGACLFFTDLIREIDLPLTTEFMAISSYGSATKSSGVVRIMKDLDNDILDKDVIIVEDIVDTGITLNYLTKILKQRGARSLKIAAMLDKKARRKVENLQVDYVCFDIPDAYVVGYGLDFDQRYRNLPDIGVLSPRIYGNG